MQACDVLIVGGGPAGSSCARRLTQAGLDVVVVDRARFPRDKVCAGWITPQVLSSLELDPVAYSRGRTFQAITGFRVGLIGGRKETAVHYKSPVSFGILRREFDAYLLERSRARIRVGQPVTRIVRDGEAWIVEDELRARWLVGAGGHFCPVARWLNPSETPTTVVAAREIEVPVEAVPGSERDRPDVVALYFSPDLSGYGWHVRKGAYVNIGFGQYMARALPRATDAFAAFLGSRGITPVDSANWHGHAYRLYSDRRRRIADAGVLLVGDAAGLAYPASGEGIRPAIESGLLGAAAILDGDRRGQGRQAGAYQEQLIARFGQPHPSKRDGLFSRLAADIAPALLASRWFVRHVVIDRWFLHASQRPLLTGQAPARQVDGSEVVE